MKLRTKRYMVLMSLAILGTCSMSVAEQPPHDPVHVPLAVDASFDRYVDLQQVADALRTQDAGSLTDLALQMAEAERILLRNHHSKLTSSELLVKAAQLAARSQDKDSLARLSNYADTSKNSSLGPEIKAATKLSADSRAGWPGVSIRNMTEITRLIAIKEWMNCINALGHCGDRDSLHAVREAIESDANIPEADKKALKSQIEDTLAASGEPATDSALQKLASTARGWNPRDTIGKIAEGDIVGAISGADFRIEGNSTSFTGSSGRHWTMVYTLKNTTPYHVTVEFSSGNTSPLPSGKTITCRSKASCWGSEKTGVTYNYPKVRARATNGTQWLRTISRDGEDYRVIRRGDGSIQIVP